MNELLVLIGFIVFIFGILEIILFFKIWGMTNHVKNIDLIVTNQNSTFDFYALAGENEKAYILLRNQLIEELLSEMEFYNYKSGFVKVADQIIESKKDKLKLIKCELPLHLSSGENFAEYYCKLNPEKVFYDTDLQDK